MPLPSHHLVRHLNLESGWFTFLVPAYPGCSRKEAMKFYQYLFCPNYTVVEIFLYNIKNRMLWNFGPAFFQFWPWYFVYWSCIFSIHVVDCCLFVHRLGVETLAWVVACTLQHCLSAGHCSTSQKYSSSTTLSTCRVPLCQIPSWKTSLLW